MTIRRVFTGKNVQEATAVALETLGAELEDVDIRVINPGRAGIFGLGGALAEIEVAKLSDVLAEEAAEAEERQRQMDEAVGVADEKQSRSRSPRPRRQQQRQPQTQEEDTAEAPQQRRSRPGPQPRRNRRQAPARQRAERTGSRPTRQPRQPRSPRRQPENTPQAAPEPQTAQLTDAVETPEIAPVQEQRTSPRRTEAPIEPIQDREELETVTSEILAYLISAMNVDVDAYVLDELRDGSVVFEIEGEDAGLLIGRRGETLRDVQFIVRMLVNRRVEQRANVIIDVERYQQRRTQKLHAIAENAARTASRGRPKSLDPMTPEERRIVHMALSDNPDVVTQSEGQGPERHVVVKPRS